MADDPATRSTPAPRSTTEWTWLVGFPVFLLVATYVGYLIADNAKDTIFESRDGQVTDTRLSPSSPGYRSIVVPTTTGALAFESGGELAMVSLLLPVGDAGGGTWLVVPGDTVGPSGSTLASAHADADQDLWTEVAELVGIQPTETAVLDDDGVAALVGPVGPLEVTLADSLSDGSQVVFAAGANQVQPGEVAALLGWLNPGESIGNRFSRQEDVVIAWMDALTGQAEPAVGAVADTKLGELVRQLASAAVIVDPIPILGTRTKGDGTFAFDADTVALQSTVRTLVPFARAADTVVLPKALVLNGASNDVTVTLGVARRLGASGAQVTAIGNADDFLREQTVIRYADDQWAEAAAALVEALGVGVAEADPIPNPAFDLTIEIGRDAVRGQ